MSISEKLTTIAENEQKVFDAGKKKEYDEFWDAVQKNGERTEYSFGFSADIWNSDNFKPKYPIAPVTAQNIFGYWGNLYNSPFYSTRIDFREACVFDTSNCTNLSNAFINNRVVTGLGTIDARKAVVSGIFNGVPNLEVVELMILKDEGSQDFGNYAFYKCEKLVEIRFQGAIGRSVDLHYSTQLSKDSITSAMTHLLEDASNQTITLSLAAVNKAFETSEGANDGTSNEEWGSLSSAAYNWSVSLI